MANIKQISIGDTVYDLKDDVSGYITGITSTMVTTALGYTPLANTIKYGADLSYSNSSLQLKDQDGNALGNAVTIESSPAIDNKSITTNSSSQLQASGVINQNDTTTALKTWSGDEDSYDAITTKDTSTLYNVIGRGVFLGSQRISANYHPPLLSCMQSDHIINDIQWLRADTFSWQDGSVYVTAYNKLVSEYSTGTEETEDGITFRRSPNGFKIADASQESAILSKYNSDGIAWYYILDTDNKRFKLPRTKWGFKGLRGNAGDNIAQTVLLPNITGGFYVAHCSAGGASGAFSSTDSGTANFVGQVSGKSHTFTFNASKSSSVYSGDGTDTLIDERATQMYLYFYVGEYSQTAIEQTAGLNSEMFNSKVDISSLSEINPMITSYVNGTSGYNIWANGYCEQWGRATTPSKSYILITLLKEFNDTDYIVLNSKAVATSYSYVTCAYDKTISTFKLQSSWSNGSWVSDTVYWKACGYLAEGEY